MKEEKLTEDSNSETGYPRAPPPPLPFDNSMVQSSGTRGLLLSRPPNAAAADEYGLPVGNNLIVGLSNNPQYYSWGALRITYNYTHCKSSSTIGQFYSLENDCGMIRPTSSHPSLHTPLSVRYPENESPASSAIGEFKHNIADILALFQLDMWREPCQLEKPFPYATLSR